MLPSHQHATVLSPLNLSLLSASAEKHDRIRTNLVVEQGWAEILRQEPRHILKLMDGPTNRLANTATHRIF